MLRRHLIAFVLSASLGLALCAPASAEVLRMRYSPQDLCGHTTLKVSPDGAKGEWQAGYLGLVKRPYYCQKTPTHLVTFRHPYTARTVAVSIAFPATGTPTIYHQTDAIVYSYGTYTVRAEFLSDGSVDVVYNSGLFRPLP
jgi:hypothetical protein